MGLDERNLAEENILELPNEEFRDLKVGEIRNFDISDTIAAPKKAKFVDFDGYVRAEGLRVSSQEILSNYISISYKITKVY